MRHIPEEKQAQLETATLSDFVGDIIVVRLRTNEMVISSRFLYSL
jgi:hypothetical protein